MGKKINKAQLIKIAGGENKVYTANSYEELIGDEFLATASKAVCSKMTSGKNEDPLIFLTYNWEYNLHIVSSNILCRYNGYFL